MATSKEVFASLFLKAFETGKIHIPCDKNRAAVLRMQMYSFRRAVRADPRASAELKLACDEVMLQLRDDGLVACTKVSDEGMQAIMQALGGEAAVVSAEAVEAPPAASPADPVMAESIAKLARIMEAPPPEPRVKQESTLYKYIEAPKND